MGQETKVDYSDLEGEIGNVRGVVDGEYSDNFVTGDLTAGQIDIIRQTANKYNNPNILGQLGVPMSSYVHGIFSYFRSRR